MTKIRLMDMDRLHALNPLPNMTCLKLNIHDKVKMFTFIFFCKFLLYFILSLGT